MKENRVRDEKKKLNNMHIKASSILLPANLIKRRSLYNNSMLKNNQDNQERERESGKLNGKYIQGVLVERRLMSRIAE